MAFMKPRIFQGNFAKIETKYSGSLLVALSSLPEGGLLGKLISKDDMEDLVDADRDALQAILRDADVSLDEFDWMETKSGFGFQLSAPGFLDQTELGFAETQAKAAQELINMYYDMSDAEMDEEQRAEYAELVEMAAQTEPTVTHPEGPTSDVAPSAQSEIGGGTAPMNEL